jgi:hypothetical protein
MMGSDLLWREMSTKGLTPSLVAFGLERGVTMDRLELTP